MHKFVSTGEWMALLILTPSSNDRSGPPGSNAASSCSHESSTRQTTRESSQEALGQALYHGSPIYHTQDTEALLGFSRHLLLDAVFDLWTFTDSLAEYRNVEDDSTLHRNQRQIAVESNFLQASHSDVLQRPLSLEPRRQQTSTRRLNDRECNVRREPAEATVTWTVR